MEKYENPLHIVSAQVAELGITFGQITTQDKRNEIVAVRELLEMLNIERCIIVADALNCQKETAKTVINGKGDYLFSVKDNQKTILKIMFKMKLCAKIWIHILLLKKIEIGLKKELHIS